MEVAFSAQALEDIHFWKRSGNKKIQERITALIEDIKQHSFSGIGKPEPLKHELSGKWSRRIDKGNRIIYAQRDNHIYIYTLRGHY